MPPFAAEHNYLDFVMTLFYAKNERLLAILLGYEWRDFLFLRPICGPYGGYRLNRANAFIFMYIYYLVHYERDSLVDSNEKVFYSKVLKHCGEAFWDSLFDKYITAPESTKTVLQELFFWFTGKMDRYERPELTWYGTGTKFPVGDDVVLDFFTFCITHLYADSTIIGKCLRAMLVDTGRSFGVSHYTAFHRYVENDNLEKYREFCSVMNGSDELPPETTDSEYELLKTALINIYRDESLIEAAKDNEIFNSKLDIFTAAVAEGIENAAKSFCDNFAQYGGDDAPEYASHYILNRNVPIIAGAVRFTENDCKQLIFKSLSNLLFKHINKCLNLSTVIRRKSKISTFVKNIDGIAADLIIGNELFSYKDTDYNVLADIKSKCRRIEAGHGFLTALNSKRIKVSVKNISVEITPPDQTYIEQCIAENRVLTVNEFPIEIDHQSASGYIRNHYRVFKIRLDMAVECLDDIVGGGVEFKLPEK